MKPLCSLDELRPDAGLEVRAEAPDGPFDLVLFRVVGQVRSYRNACPHQGRNLAFAPDEFLFDPDGRLICPHHGASFDVATGECVDGPCKGAFLTRLTVLIRDGMVYLK